MVIEVLVHQHSPLVGREATEEGVRVRGACRRTARVKTIYQRAHACALRLEVALVGDLHERRGGRIATERRVRTELPRFHEAAEDAADEESWRERVAERGLEGDGAVGEHLGGGHFAPLAWGVGAELLEAVLSFGDASGVEEGFHRALVRQ